MSIAPTKFVLQFDPAHISALALRYGPEGDEDAFTAGRNILGGDYSPENLKVIVRWKSPRKIAFIDRNSSADIARFLRFATGLKTTEKDAVEALDKLHGVGIPMASAILTAVHPDRYTVIDVRALESLGVSKYPTESVEYYLEYLTECRRLAHAYKVSLRTFDRALWQWSKESGKAKSACAY